MEIVPTIIKKEFGEAEKRIRMVEGTSRWAQVDVIDGTFRPEKTFELELLSTIEEIGVLWEIHLLVKEPISWVEKCLFVGASRIIGQVEMMRDRGEFVKKVKNEQIEVGLGFDIDTEIGDIPNETDWVLLMARRAGFGDEPFKDKVYKKIAMAKKMGFKVGVDGGVGVENMEKLRGAGVDVIYSGSNYFELIDADK